MKNVSIEMTWEGAAKEVAVGGEFNGWAPVPLACQQVTSNTKTHNYTSTSMDSSACLKQAGHVMEDNFLASVNSNPPYVPEREMGCLS